MTKLEKTIRGLECCLNTGNFEECTENCPYFTKKFGVGVCSENMMRDALELLKTQEPMSPTIKQEMDDICSCIDDVAYCGKCGAWIGRLKQNYCSNCGQAVKWE